VVGAILNAGSIVVGSLVASRLAEPSTHALRRMRILISVMLVYSGLSMTWSGFHGSFSMVMKQLGLTILSLSLGKLTGHLLGLQHRLTLLGRQAKLTLTGPVDPKQQFSSAFKACCIFFCLSPLTVPGCLAEGLGGDFRALAVKAAMDGLAAMSFAKTLGWGSGFSAIPVFVLQGTLTLCARAIRPWAEANNFVDPWFAVLGLMVFTVSLVALELKKIEFADYLPSLLYAIAFAKWLGW
jgi:uncharacterized membrane protein YqgA involved in biofilm formation